MGTNRSGSIPWLPDRPCLTAHERVCSQAFHDQSAFGSVVGPAAACRLADGPSAPVAALAEEPPARDDCQLGPVDPTLLPCPLPRRPSRPGHGSSDPDTEPDW